VALSVFEQVGDGKADIEWLPSVHGPGMKKAWRQAAFCEFLEKTIWSKLPRPWHR
jgi:hypothetical protein